jgi:hypothetical protein
MFVVSATRAGDSPANAPVVAENTDRPTPTDVTYSNQIARIIQRRCQSCHRTGEVAPFALMSYSDAAKWAETIAEVVREQRMPPWHASPKHGRFANDPRLTDDEKQLIAEWVAAGTPEGDPADLPKPIDWTDGWRIGKPDVVLTMPRKFDVPATGTVDYQYYVVDPGFTEDKWVRAAECRPGNRAVTHHIVIFVQPGGGPSVQSKGGFGFDMLAATAPGMPPLVLPEGHARFVPAGSKLVFQMHYTPNGTAQSDRSSVGLVFGDPRDVKKEVRADAALNLFFRIPPGAKDHVITAKHRFGQDTILFSLLPHMHLRGKSFRIEAKYPDGSEEVLLDVPKYEFNWQHIYQFAEPKHVPEGTELLCTARYDNSSDNPANPDPDKEVSFGLQTSQEMMVGLFDMALAEQDLTLGSPQVKPLEHGDCEVLFRYRAPESAAAVYLAGTFNEWKPDGHAMDGPGDAGLFSTRLILKPGRYEYKFVIDGKTWRHDPANRQQAGFYHNSVLVVPEPASE